VTSWAAADDAARMTATPAMNVERIFLSSGGTESPSAIFSDIFF
jgi:hypothetical protein